MYSRYNLNFRQSFLIYLVIILLSISVIKDIALYASGRGGEIQFLINFLSLRFEVGRDSWWPMYEALIHHYSEKETGIYEEIFFTKRIKFQYPPSSINLPIFTRWLGVSNLDDFIWVMNLAMFFCVFLIAISCLLIVYSLNSLDGSVTVQNHLLVFLVVVLGTFTFNPIIRGHDLGQIQVLINLFACLAIFFWIGGKKFLCGVVISCAAIIKPQFFLFIIWGLIRKEREFLYGFLVCVVPIGVLSVVNFGIREHLDYIGVLSYIGQHGEVFWANQSVNGFLNRLIENGSSLRWSGSSFADFDSIVYLGTTISSAVIILAAVLYRPGWTVNGLGQATERRIESVLDLSTAQMAFTLASPVAWVHHYAVAWPILVVCFVLLLRNFEAIPKWMRYVSVLGLSFSYLMISNYLTPLAPFASSPFNVLQSFVFFGGAVLFVVLIILRRSPEFCGFYGRRTS